MPLPSAAQLAAVSGLLADGTRAAFCLALLDGRAWTATELAEHAGVARSTASEQLTALVRGGLLEEVRQGRHRYLRLAGPDAAHVVEHLAGLVGSPPPRPTSLRAARAARHLAEARTCYDHLAGRLAVELLDAMVDRRLLDDGPALTSRGRTWCTDLLGPDALSRNPTRPLVRTCLDWTERRPHLAGAVGAALLSGFLDRGWLQRGDGRALRLTDAGSDALADRLGRRVA